MSPKGEKPAGKKKGASAEKRERILQAAISVFAQKGFYDTRVSEIAKAAGVADGTIYLYFENKDDVLISIFQDRIEKLLEILGEVAASDRSIEEKVRKIVGIQLGLLEDQRDLAEVITVNLRQSSRLLKQYAAPLFIRYLELVAGVIATGQKEGVFRQDLSPRVAARALYGALDGLALTWALGPMAEDGEDAKKPEPAQLRKAAIQLTELFLDGLRARAGVPA
jgi:TetR/AcrR family fatty acid metabolism transcriptional regulator